MNSHRIFALSFVVLLQLSCTPKHVQLDGNLAKNATASRATHEAIDKDFMIVSQGRASSLAAKQMYALGGNIIDAAVATSFAISVERPQSTGIGGGGFMLIHWAKTGKVEAVDFRERAPLLAHEKMYQDKKGAVIQGLSRNGAKAVAVPGTVAGLLEIHEKYGDLNLEQVMAPALALASKGFVVYPHLAKAIEARAEELKKYPASKALFFKANGQPYQVGDTFVQRDLYRTLWTIARKGRAGFYEGWVAHKFVEEQKRLGGLIAHKDLKNYEVKWRKPVQGNYQGYDVYSMSPPSSGGIHVIQILNILEQDDLRKNGPYHPQSIHLTASAMQLAFQDRAKHLGDADFVKVPTDGLTSQSYANMQRKSIDPERAWVSKEMTPMDPFAFESNDTTHFSLADKNGNVVSSTQTINGWIGSGVVVPGAGFVMNNEMDDFSSKPGVANMFGLVGGNENAIAPGKRPLSSMSPSIILKDKKPVLALGSPAGSRIITCVTLTALNYLHFKMPLFQAVASKRYHHQWLPDHIQVESPGFADGTDTELKGMGYEIKNKDIGCKVQAISFEKGKLHGVSDPRGEGLAIGKNTVLPKDLQNYSGKVVQD